LIFDRVFLFTCHISRGGALLTVLTVVSVNVVFVSLILVIDEYLFNACAPSGFSGHQSTVLTNLFPCVIPAVVFVRVYVSNVCVYVHCWCDRRFLLHRYSVECVHSSACVFVVWQFDVLLILVDKDIGSVDAPLFTL